MESLVPQQFLWGSDPFTENSRTNKKRTKLQIEFEEDVVDLTELEPPQKQVWQKKKHFDTFEQLKRSPVYCAPTCKVAFTVFFFSVDPGFANMASGYGYFEVQPNGECKMVFDRRFLKTDLVCDPRATDSELASNVEMWLRKKFSGCEDWLRVALPVIERQYIDWRKTGRTMPPWSAIQLQKLQTSLFCNLQAEWLRCKPRTIESRQVAKFFDIKGKSYDEGKAAKLKKAKSLVNDKKQEAFIDDHHKADVVLQSYYFAFQYMENVQSPLKHPIKVQIVDKLDKDPMGDILK